MSFRVSFPCTSEEQVGSVIERVLALHGYSVEVHRGESCEVESSSLIDTLEEFIQDEPIDVYIRITSGVYYEINNELNIMYREILDSIRYL
ncbi:MAG: hypothetical protein RXO22_01795 [Thermocladium sp.]